MELRTKRQGRRVRAGSNSALRAAHLVLNKEKIIAGSRFKNTTNIVRLKHNFMLNM